jgi:hypothetical protein
MIIAEDIVEYFKMENDCTEKLKVVEIHGSIEEVTYLKREDIDFEKYNYVCTDYEISGCDIYEECTTKECIATHMKY